MKGFLRPERSRLEERPTTDDWYPNLPGNMVRIRLCQLSNGLWRVSVWGDDDCGMEIDVLTRGKAIEVWKSLPVIITKQDLRERGFINA